MRGCKTGRQSYLNLVAAFKAYNYTGALIKHHSPTVKISQFKAETTYLSSILMLDDCAGERLSLEVILRYWLCKSVKMPSFGCKEHFGVFSY